MSLAKSGLLVVVALLLSTCLAPEKKLIHCSGGGGVDCPDDMVCAPDGSPVCVPSGCGDHITNYTEDCDDAGESATCNINCKWSKCGDMIVNHTAGEECDNGKDNVPPDTTKCPDGKDSCTLCAAECQIFNITPAPHACKPKDPPEETCPYRTHGPNICQVCTKDFELVLVQGPYCGDKSPNNSPEKACDDGAKNGTTECDYGPPTACEICNADCTAKVQGVARYCGDGIIQPEFEQCDDKKDGSLCKNCNWVPQPTATCTIDSAPYNDGDLNPNNPCQMCAAKANPARWTARTGEACNDGITTSCPRSAPATCDSNGSCLGNFKQNDPIINTPAWTIPQSPPDTAYKVIGGEAVLDTQTCLMWQLKTTLSTEADGTFSWGNATTSCGKSTTSGYTDWRLPTFVELGSLVDHSKKPPGPAINNVFAITTQTNAYWSSTLGPQGSAWCVSFYDGSSFNIAVSNNNFVRCVR